MFSAYVVTPVPPPAPATIVAMPSPRNARPRYAIEILAGHRGDRLDVAQVLRDEHDRHRRDQQPSPARSQTGAVNFGRPNHGAAATAREVDRLAEAERRWSSAAYST